MPDIPKNHVRVGGTVYTSYRMPVSTLIENLREVVRTYPGAVIDDGYFEIDWTGFRPMNEEEIAAAEKRREAQKRAAAARKEKQRLKDEAQLEALAKKLGRTVK